MPFHAGQTFLYPLTETETAHLWIIATEPDENDEFAVVSLTSLKGAKDQTVILAAGEHPFIRKETCVCYALAEVTTSEKVQEHIACGLAKMRDDLSAELLALVVNGFSASDFTKRRILEFVRTHKSR